MIEVLITPNMVEKAKKKATELGTLKNSITKGKGNLAGFIGEFVAEQVTGGKIKNTKDYDLVLKDDATVDVKTKRCTSEPRPHYECSIAAYNPAQKCDKYIFVRVMKDLTKAWVLGELDKEVYFEKAHFLEKGQYDPSNNWRCKADCYNVAISELNEVSSSDSDTA
tara:strand:+ start:1052 stop:1549 length:498 start_codon:yes stop_codon:yes gene_type:complete